MKQDKRNIQIFLLSISFLFFFLGRGFYIPGIPLFFENLSRSYFIVGIASLMFSLSFALSPYFWGYISDRIRERKIIGVLGFILNSLALYFLSILRNVPIALALRMIEGVGASAIYTIIPAVAGDLSVKSSKFGMNISFIRMIGSLGFSIAAILLFFVKIEYSFILVLSSALLLLGSFFMTPVNIKMESGKGNENMKFTPFKYLNFLLAVFLWSMGFMSVMSLWPNYIVSIGYSKNYVYLYWSYAAFLEVPFMTLIGRFVDKGKMFPIFLYGTISFILAYLLYIYPINCYVLFLAQTLRALGYSSFEVATMVYATRSVDIFNRGKLMGLRNLSLSIGWTLGSLYSGTIAQIFGFKSLILSSMLFLLAAMITFYKKQ